MWIRRQKFTELEEKVNKLDPEKIAEKVQKTSEGWLTNTANKVVEEKIKGLSDSLTKLQQDWKTTDNQLKELTGKVKNLASSIQKVVSQVKQNIKSILDVLEKESS